MKVLVETTSSMMLLDPISGCTVEYNRPSLVPWTSFLDTRTGLGQVKVLANDIPDDITEENWLSFWKDSDKKPELAVESFLAAVHPQEKKKKK